MTRLIQDQSTTIVRERDRRRLQAMAGMLCLGCVLVGGVLGYVWLQVQRVRVSYGLETLRASRTRLEEQNRKLQLELASLRAFARVDSAARRLGLTAPAPDQVRLAREYVAPDGAVAFTFSRLNSRTKCVDPSRPTSKYTLLCMKPVMTSGSPVQGLKRESVYGVCVSTVLTMAPDAAPGKPSAADTSSERAQPSRR